MKKDSVKVLMPDHPLYTEAVEALKTCLNTSSHPSSERYVPEKGHRARFIGLMYRFGITMNLQIDPVYSQTLAYVNSLGVSVLFPSSPGAPSISKRMSNPGYAVFTSSRMALTKCNASAMVGSSMRCIGSGIL